MARQTVTTQSISRAGLNVTMSAPNVDGDIIDSGAVFLEVLNGSGSPITVTVQTPKVYEGLALADLTVSVPAAGNRRIGPFPASVFKQDSDAVTGPGKVLVDYSAITSVTRAVVALGA